MITNQQKQGIELMNTLVKEAWENVTFKDQLVKNPSLAIENFTGKNFVVPVGKKIVVEDQTDESIIYLNIPAELDLDELELTEEQLEAISGGVTPAVYVAGAVIGFAACALIDYLRD